MAHQGGYGGSRRKPRKKPKPKRWALALLLVPVIFVAGCVGVQDQLEQTRAMLKDARTQEANLLVQSQGSSLTAPEANAVQTSLDRTRALIKNLEEQEAILEQRVQQGLADWAGIASQVLGGVLGIGALAGRRPT